MNARFVAFFAASLALLQKFECSLSHGLFFVGAENDVVSCVSYFAVGVFPTTTGELLSTVLFLATCICDLIQCLLFG